MTDASYDALSHAKRHLGRSVALKLLYQVDVTAAVGDRLDQAIADYFVHLDPQADADVRRFAEHLCRGVVAQLGSIDRTIEQASQHWRIERMGRVDRNVLRLATYELMCEPDVPVGVAINEAVEMGKAFGSEETASFVNGVLDRVRRDLGR